MHHIRVSNALIFTTELYVHRVSRMKINDDDANSRKIEENVVRGLAVGGCEGSGGEPADGGGHGARGERLQSRIGSIQ